ncbi:MAG: DNA repair and recombination protein RadB [Candidatus Pacearchaeota archaeon]
MEDNKISTGSYDLNKFFYGGYEKDIITTIYGPAGSGKTNLCILCAVSQAKKGNKVIFMDTEGGFSVERVYQILERNKEESERVLKNILLLKPTSFKEQEKDFEILLKNVKEEKISLIIIDSIAMLYRLELSDAIKTEDNLEIQKVNRKLAQQLRTLNEISRKRKIPILITNQVYSLFPKNEEEQKEREVSMVGGDLLKYWSKCLIELRNNNGKRTLILKKHRSLPEKQMDFEIYDKGIRKKGWI